ncbi:PilZ domain-containing protein [Microvenator marinus]|uniref:PilZ domain-containing protein n=1 Tax=Microvenator marinus TaxID=2600177 RepID=A0A5B8XS68_9DELT|nr:PilZ domain-containing protein [Microvenator marinus]QED26476.1 PilZ domain-containing protein [Microvenator marinus]
MRPIILPSTRDSETQTQLRSGPGAPIFEQSGPHTRIFRAPVRAIASVRFENREIYGQVLDLAPGGCLLKTESTIAEGTKIELRVTIIKHDSRSVAEVRGTVRRATESEGRRAYGVEFEAMDSSERNTLQWLYSQALEV